MFGTYTYHESLRRLTIAFGQIFNNIQIKRKNSADSTLQSIKVPLAYGPKEKFLVRLDQQADLNDRSFALRLPRVGFEIAGIEYIEDKKGEIYTYDVNTNTNYNSQAEKNSEIKGMRSIAKFLKEELLLLSNIKIVA